MNHPVLCTFTGEVFNGRWDGWYGPSGRDPDLTYDLNLVKNSSVGKAFRNNGFSFPSRRRMKQIRQNATVSCDMPKNRSNFLIKLFMNLVYVHKWQLTIFYSFVAEVCNLRKEVYCLFDVAKDPCEQINRAKDEPQILQNLIVALRNYKPVPALNKPADPRSDPKYWNYTWNNWVDYI